MEGVIKREMEIAQYYSEVLNQLIKNGEGSTKQADFCRHTINTALLIVWKCL